MDQTTTTNPSEVTSSPSPLPEPQTPSFNSKPAGGGGMKMLLIVVVVLVVLAAAGGGAYYWFTTQNQPQQVASNTTVSNYTPKPVAAQDSLEQQANSVNETPVESDLTPVDQDINSMSASASAAPATKK